jgi:hypothetical protein
LEITSSSGTIKASQLNLNTFHVTPEREKGSLLWTSSLRTGRDADTIDDHAELLEDRIRSLEQVGLTAPHAQRTQLQALKRRVRVDGYNSEKLNIPTCMESETGFECPVCLFS